jgi:hypothetical protein
MKCKYSFPIKGQVRFPIGINFCGGKRVYEFKVKKGVLSELSVTFCDFPEICLPTIVQHKEGKIKASISVPPDPFWDDMVSDIRAIEGALCIWGIAEINVDYCTTEWIPETESEKEKVQMFSFSRTRSGEPPENLPNAPIHLFVRSVLAVSDLKEAEIPLNFYRRGRLDVFEERYIDAIYNLYFVFETLFADGRFKKNDVVRKFRASKELLDAMDQVQKDIDPEIRSNKTLLKEYREKYVNKTKEEIIEHIVDLRGFLHHHTLKKKDIWHPSKQRTFKVDALTLLKICHHIALKRTISVLFKQERVEEFLKTEVKTEDGRTIRWNEQK